MLVVFIYLFLYLSIYLSTYGWYAMNYNFMLQMVLQLDRLVPTNHTELELSVAADWPPAVCTDTDRYC